MLFSRIGNIAILIKCGRIYSFDWVGGKIFTQLNSCYWTKIR